MITGTLTTSIGKGAHFVPKYVHFFREKLGFIPYPGTLNLKVEKMPSLPASKKIEIRPENDLGDVDCYKILIQKKYKGAIIVPHKSTHQNIIEIISPFHLREDLKLKDGDEITCELE